MQTIKQPLGIDQCNCFTLRKAARQISRLYDSAAVNALAERLDIERTAMGKMAGFLERDGLVTIKPSPTDGRSRIIELTRKGSRLHEEAAPLWRAAQRQFQQLNGAEEVVALRQGLAGMTVGDVPASQSED